jgi:hypothetical protein
MRKEPASPMGSYPVILGSHHRWRMAVAVESLFCSVHRVRYSSRLSTAQGSRPGREQFS